ncbi:MAG: hypothetical protein PUA96_03645 [Bacteroidales bacterium]|nr:hypothetical protein [Bacteroidales bacterium]
MFRVTDGHNLLQEFRQIVLDLLAERGHQWFVLHIRSFSRIRNIRILVLCRYGGDGIRRMTLCGFCISCRFCGYGTGADADARILGLLKEGLDGDAGAV